MRPKIILYYNDLVFQPSESFLFKDFGQVPFVISKMNDADLEYWIAANNVNSDFSSFRGKVVRQFSKRLRALPARLDVLKNSGLYRAIGREEALTHLILFPFTPFTDLLVAKRARRRGAKIILKLDTNVDYLDKLATDWRRYRRRPSRFMRQFYHYRELLSLADLIMCETSQCEERLRSGYLGLDLEHRLIKTYSGLSEAWIAELGIEESRPNARRNAIIVSGRISSWQKNSELIFQAGPPPPGWTIEFIGEVDVALRELIERHRAADPSFDSYYRFHGAIADKRTYFELLMRARALLMNSRGGEGFPNVFAEAHFCRLLILTSDVSGADDATESGRWGIVYPKDDAAALRNALQALPARIAAAEGKTVSETHRRRFIWEHSLAQPLIQRLFDNRAGSVAAG